MLLPFVHGIDTSALSCALAFAEEENAALLLVSLIRAPKGRGIRAESIAQAHDFFELMAHKAAKAGITIKRTQLSTQQIARSTSALAQEMACTGILLFVRDGTGVLMETEDIKKILEKPRQPVYLFRLAPGKNPLTRPGSSLARWLRL